MKKLPVLLSAMFLVLLVNFDAWAQAPGSKIGGPQISALKFSANPVAPGEKFLISFEFEGDVERFFIENTFETESGEIKRDLKEFSIPPETKAGQKGIITRQWETQKGSTVKPYRILGVWVKDANGSQSNVLSQELKIAVVTLTIPKESQWLVGQWIGTIFIGGDKLRSLEIVAIEGNTYKGKYGIPGEKMSEIPIQIIGDKIEFDTPAKARVVLSKIHETRMDGTFTVTSGKQMGVRYWKESHIAPPDLEPMMGGEWSGQWKHFASNTSLANVRLKVEFTDMERASVFYYWGDYTDLRGTFRKSGWSREDAVVYAQKKKIEFKDFKFELDGKDLKGTRNDGFDTISSILKKN